MSVLWMCAFIALKVKKKLELQDKYFEKNSFQFTPTLIENLGMDGTMFLFSFNSLLGALFITIFLPETMGKSFEEIAKMLEN